MKNAKSKPKVVIDTNVFISSLVFGGKPREVTDLIAEKSILVVISEECLSELRRKVIARFPDFIEDLKRLELLLQRRALTVKLGVPGISIVRDPDDDKFIETAFVGAAGYIVSGDKDLLDLKEYKGIKIVKPAQFLKLAVV